MNRVRTEFEENMAGLAEDQSIEDTMSRDCINLDTCSDLTYLGQVINEALRVSPPGPFSSHLVFDRDTTVVGLQVKANEKMIMSFQHLQFNSKYW